MKQLKIGSLIKSKDEDFYFNCFGIVVAMAAGIPGCWNGYCVKFFYKGKFYRRLFYERECEVICD